MVKTIIVNKLVSDEEMEQLEGEYFSQKEFHTILKESADVYTSNGELLLKFRKRVIPKELTDLALCCYRSQAKVKHNNRGAAAGVLDTRKLPSFVKGLNNPQKFRTGFIKKDNRISQTKIGNLAPSNIAGYFDSPSRANTGEKKNPCRLTAFTNNHSKLWEKSLPFLEHCDKLFQELTPEKHYKQWLAANLTPEYNIQSTAFSTITLNYSWRTALHKDAGDFKEGFGNLIVIEDDKNPNKYKGCYIGFPQYGVAVDLRTGDYLGMDVHQWHCNTEFLDVVAPKPHQGDSDVLSSLRESGPPSVKEWTYNRLSIVCYLREKMIRCRAILVPTNDEAADKISLKKMYSKLYRKLPS